MTDFALTASEDDPLGFGAIESRHRAFLEETYPRWGRRQSDALARELKQGSVRGIAWSREGSPSRGGVWLEVLPHEVRVHGLWAEQRPLHEPLGPLLAALEGRFDRPVGVLTDALPGLSDADQTRLLPAYGFWHRAKVRMRRAPRPKETSPPAPPEVREVEAPDLPELVGVYARAYSDRPGEFWTWENPGHQHEAERDVLGHLDPEGTWKPDFHASASLVWVESGKPLGAIFVSRRLGGVPYVEDLIVEPSAQRRGIGRALLSASLQRLVEGGASAIELAAVQHGAPYRLYRSMGFSPVGPPEGRLDGHWVRGPSPW